MARWDPAHPKAKKIRNSMDAMKSVFWVTNMAAIPAAATAEATRILQNQQTARLSAVPPRMQTGAVFNTLQAGTPDGDGKRQKTNGACPAPLARSDSPVPMGRLDQGQTPPVFPARPHFVPPACVPPPPPPDPQPPTADNRPNVPQPPRHPPRLPQATWPFSPPIDLNRPHAAAGAAGLHPWIEALMDSCGFESKSTGDIDVYLPERLAASAKMADRPFIRAKVSPSIEATFAGAKSRDVKASLVSPEEHARAFQLAEEYGLLTKSFPEKRDAAGLAVARVCTVSAVARPGSVCMDT